MSSGMPSALWHRGPPPPIQGSLAALGRMEPRTLPITLQKCPIPDTVPLQGPDLGTKVGEPHFEPERSVGVKMPPTTSPPVRSSGQTDVGVRGMWWWGFRVPPVHSSLTSAEG